MLRPCEVPQLTRNDIRIPGDIVLTSTNGRVAGLVINNGKTAKNGKPHVAIGEDGLAYRTLEILMHTTRKMPKSTNLFANITYGNYNKQIQSAAQFFGLKDVNVTNHGARLGKAVKNFNSRVLLDDIAVDGRWADLNSAISYILNGKASLAKINMSAYMQSEIIKHEKHFTKMVRERWDKIYKTGPPKILTLTE